MASVLFLVGFIPQCNKQNYAIDFSGRGAPGFVQHPREPMIRYP